MGYWKTDIEQIPEGQTDEGKFILQMYEFDCMDGQLIDVDEPAATAGHTFPTWTMAQMAADKFGIRIANTRDV